MKAETSSSARWRSKSRAHARTVMSIQQPKSMDNNESKPIRPRWEAAARRPTVRNTCPSSFFSLTRDPFWRIANERRPLSTFCILAPLRPILGAPLRGCKRQVLRLFLPHSALSALFLLPRISSLLLSTNFCLQDPPLHSFLLYETANTPTWWQLVHLHNQPDSPEHMPGIKYLYVIPRMRLL